MTSIVGLQAADWLIWSLKRGGVWWGPNQIGYTQNLNEAGRYSLVEAAEICINSNFDTSAPPLTVMVPSPELRARMEAS